MFWYYGYQISTSDPDFSILQYHPLQSYALLSPPTSMASKGCNSALEGIVLMILFIIQNIDTWFCPLFQNFFYNLRHHVHKALSKFCFQSEPSGAIPHLNRLYSLTYDHHPLALYSAPGDSGYLAIITYHISGFILVNKHWCFWGRF